MKFSGLFTAALVGAAVAAPTKKADPLGSITTTVAGLKDKVATTLASIRTFRLNSLC